MSCAAQQSGAPAATPQHCGLPARVMQLLLPTHSNCTAINKTHASRDLAFRTWLHDRPQAGAACSWCCAPAPQDNPRWRHLQQQLQTHAAAATATATAAPVVTAALPAPLTRPPSAAASAAAAAHTRGARGPAAWRSLRGTPPALHGLANPKHGLAKGLRRWGIAGQGGV